MAVRKKQKTVGISNLLVPQGDWYAVIEEDDYLFTEPVALWGVFKGQVVGLCSDYEGNLIPFEEDCIGYIKVRPNQDPGAEALRWYQGRPGADGEEDEVDDEGYDEDDEDDEDDKGDKGDD